VVDTPGDLHIRLQRPNNPGDRAAVLDLTTKAFGEEGEKFALLVRALQASDAYDGLSFMAEAERRMVGHTMLTRSWVDAPDRLVDVLVLSPLSVHPDYQGRGIGRALVARALQAADNAGSPAVFVEGDPGYYGQLGFGGATSRGFTRPSVRIPEATFQVVTLAAYEQWMTGAVVYSDRFWSLDCVGVR
jgi:putative acetyltransferase